MLKRREHAFAVLAYKESPYLEQCIASLKSQALQSGIFIYTSTGSDFLDTISDRFNIPVVLNGVSDGIASDWSFAYNSCNARYVTLVHQDDIYLPNYTKACLAAAESDNHKNVIIFTDYKEIFEDNAMSFNIDSIIKRILLTPFMFKRTISSPFMIRSVLSLGSPIGCPSVTFNKDKIGNFEFSKELSSALDLEAWLRLSRLAGGFRYIQDALMLHRIHKDSQLHISTKNRIRMKEEEIVFSKFWPKPIPKILAAIHYINQVLTGRK